MALGAGEGESWEGPRESSTPGSPAGGACSAHRGTGLDPAELQRHAAGVSRTLSVCYSRKKCPSTW